MPQKAIYYRDPSTFCQRIPRLSAQSKSVIVCLQILQCASHIKTYIGYCLGNDCSRVATLIADLSVKTKDGRFYLRTSSQTLATRTLAQLTSFAIRGCHNEHQEHLRDPSHIIPSQYECRNLLQMLDDNSCPASSASTTRLTCFDTANLRDIFLCCVRRSVIAALVLPYRPKFSSDKDWISCGRNLCQAAISFRR